MTADPRDARRESPLDMPPEEFERLGHQLVSAIAKFLRELRDRRVVPDEPITRVRDMLAGAPLPDRGEDPAAILADAMSLLFDHSVFTTHPRFWGYINGAAGPIAALADMLATAVNPQVAAWYVGPAACAIEAQTLRWLASAVGYPETAGGLMVSGGTVANLIALACARHTALAPDLRRDGLGEQAPRVVFYATEQAHTWLEKAAHLLGHGTRGIREIATDADDRMIPERLAEALVADRARGLLPCCVIATAGTTSTGAVDPLPAIARICREQDVWFHVDGAYGAFAALSSHAPDDLAGLGEADSLALDPHKWLYSSLEAGCVLVRDPRHLHAAFSHESSFYKGRDDAEPIPFREYGLQTSRGFRALKVWMCLRQAGREGYRAMITADIELARGLYERAAAHPLLEPLSQGLSITTFRFVPAELTPGDPDVDAYLDALNDALLRRIQRAGEFYPSRARVRGVFAIRVCVVDFRTTAADLDALAERVAELGEQLDRADRPARLRGA